MNNYIKKLIKLEKKLNRINKKNRIGIDEYFCMRWVEILNNRIWNEKLEIANDEYEYIKFEPAHLTLDWENRYNLELKDDDKKNLQEFLQLNQ